MEPAGNIRLEAPQNESDREWLKHLWIQEWGGDHVISKGNRHYVQDLHAVIAWQEEQRVGAATYRPNGGECELTSLNAVMQGAGLGSRLIAEVEQRARQLGARRLWLITTNDNLDALRFYQRRGYRIAAVFPDAVDEARKLKPSIPQVGYFEIPLHDEIELAKWL